jgi:hydrogenase 3 maturation protease
VTLKTILKKRLNKARRIAILGVGSELRGDDAAGVLIADALSKECFNIETQVALRIFNGATAPENLTGEIKKFKPTHLVIIDSANMDKLAGAVQVINMGRVGGFSFCTHNLPIKILTDYLIKSIGCKVTLIGIQPKKLLFAAPPSREVRKSVKYIVETIKDIYAGFPPR